eukprot:TRINITY_DN3700_c0_g1_i1.p1 TRINITY_DN3700_c0_g1~~TRINITY_DN3700_c0_g1_i1.p1  ORF type:complete len:430 (-),score=77.40 TRINITY_DN3700_c0_g1_i1:105-1394(-)
MIPVVSISDLTLGLNATYAGSDVNTNGVPVDQWSLAINGTGLGKLTTMSNYPNSPVALSTSDNATGDLFFDVDFGLPSPNAFGDALSLAQDCVYFPAPTADVLDRLHSHPAAKHDSLLNLYRLFHVDSPSLSMQRPVLDQAMVDRVNNAPASTWTAHMSPRFEDISVEEASRMMGGMTLPARTVPKSLRRNTIHSSAADRLGLPKAFDSREQWPTCIHPIRNQGVCGSCWAHGSSESASDRMCIATGGKTNVVLSPQYLNSCDFSDFGCSGGSFDHPWEFIVDRGLPADECVPYLSGNTSDVTEACPSQCTNASYAGNLTMHQAQSCHPVGPDPVAIQLEIMTNGPVTADFLVYNDFILYSSGVYQHINGTILGGHAIKVIGWGVSSDGLPFWTVANSWGTAWGESGFFNILRGSDECGIESSVVAGVF